MDDFDWKEVLLYIVIYLAVALSCYWLVGGDVPDFFRGTAPVREELDRAAGYQRQAEQGIRDAEKSAEGITGAIDRSEEAVSGAAGTARRIESDSQRAGILIAECQQIIETVRRRGKVPATQN